MYKFITNFNYFNFFIFSIMWSNIENNFTDHLKKRIKKEKLVKKYFIFSI